MEGIELLEPWVYICFKVTKIIVNFITFGLYLLEKCVFKPFSTRGQNSVTSVSGDSCEAGFPHVDPGGKRSYGKTAADVPE